MGWAVRGGVSVYTVGIRGGLTWSLLRELAEDGRFRTGHCVGDGDGDGEEAHPSLGFGIRVMEEDLSDLAQ